MDYPLDKLRVLEQKLTLGSGDNKDFWNQVVLPEIESINTSVSSSYKAIINAIETDTTEGNTISKKINDLKNTIGIVFTTLHRLSKKYEEMTGTTGATMSLLNAPFLQINFDKVIPNLNSLYKKTRKTSGLSIHHSGPSKERVFWILPEKLDLLKLEVAKHLNLHLNNSLYQDLYEMYLDDNHLHLYYNRLLRKKDAVTFNIGWEGDDKKNCYLERSTYNTIWTSSNHISERLFIDWPVLNRFINNEETPAQVAQHILSKYQDTSSYDSTELTEICSQIQQSILSSKIQPLVRTDTKRITFSDNDFALTIDTDITYNQRLDPKSSTNTKGQVFLPFGVVTVSQQSLATPTWLLDLIQSHLLFEVDGYSNHINALACLYPDRVKALPWWFNTKLIYLDGFPSQQWYRQLDCPQELFDMVAIKSTRSTWKYDPIIIDPDAIATDDKRETRFTLIELEEDSETDLLIDDKKRKRKVALVPEKIKSHEKEPEKKEKKDNKENPKVDNEPSWFAEEPEKKRGIFGFFGRGKVKTIKSIVQPIRVEPKTYFANERTLLQWLSMSVFITLGALTLIAASSSPVGVYISIGIIIFALLFTLYSLGIYHFRRRAIQSTSAEGKYEDKWGPTVLVIILCIFLIVSLVQLINPPPLPIIPGIPSNREYRQPISSTFFLILSDNPSRDRLFERTVAELQLLLGLDAVRGNLSIVSSHIINYFDTPSCDLNKANIVCKSMRRINEAKISEIECSLSSLDVKVAERISTDPARGRDIFSILKSNRVVHERYVNIHTESGIFHFIALTNKESPFSTISSVSKLFSVLGLEEYTSSVAGRRLGIVKSLEVNVYGNVNIDFGSRLKKADLNVVTYSQDSNLAYAEFIIDYPTFTNITITRAELNKINTLKRVFGILPEVSETEDSINNLIFGQCP